MDVRSFGRAPTIYSDSPYLNYSNADTYIYPADVNIDIDMRDQKSLFLMLIA